jgi:hypothetical protein
MRPRILGGEADVSDTINEGCKDERKFVKTIKIFVVDDHPLFRFGLYLYLMNTLISGRRRCANALKHYRGSRMSGLSW